MFDKLGDILANTKFKLASESPTIAIGAGIIGLGVSIVLSSRATLKAQKVVEEHKAGLVEAHENYVLIKDDVDKEGKPKFTEKDYQRTQFNVVVKTSGKLLKLYGPTIVLAGLSIASIVYGRNVFQNRLTSLSAAYQVVSSTLESYRKRVAEEVGEEKEDELYYDILKNKAVGAMVDDEDKAVIKKGPVTPGVYARFFDEGSPNYTRRSGENRIFLTSAQAMFNDLLNRRGYVTLNQVYDHLGLEETPEGQYIGWYRRNQGSEDVKYIDFGIFNLDNERTRAFINDQEPSVLLDFNVDGFILDRM